MPDPQVPYPIDHAAVVAAFPEFVVEPRPIGIGGMKNAYLAWSDDEEVVLKVIREPAVPAEEADDTTDRLITLPERFTREIKGMRTISHPGVVRILAGPEVREIDGAPRGWYVEPHYPGGTMADRMGEPWSQASTLELLAALVAVVEVLSAAGITHRDIKPGNIVFDAAGNPVVLDLGIAYFLDLTPITNEFGRSPLSTHYAAPEQFEVRSNVQIDFRTDLFLVGLVAFEAFTGVHPYQPTYDGYLGRLMEGQFAADALDAASPTPTFRTLLTRLIAPSRAKRFRKIEHVTRAIGECT